MEMWVWWIRDMNGGEKVGGQYEEGKTLRVVVKWEVSSGVETGSMGMKSDHV